MIVLPKTCLQNEPLAKYTAARLGGTADWLYIARDSVDEITSIVAQAWAQGLPVRVLGGGANVLVADAGFRGLVVVNRVAHITFAEDRIMATSGTAMTTLANRCQKHGIRGFEWMVSVPGTVGGGVINNAGAHGGDMAHNILSVKTAEPDGTHLYTQADLHYEYRGSMLKHRTDRHFLVLEATFATEADDPANIRARMDEMVAYRKRTQPPGASLGSIFKNPPGDYAGRLIEASGLKGYQLGGVMVSPVHANFIVNIDTQTATAADYYTLIRHVQRTVKAQTHIDLSLEIELIGEFGTVE